MKQPFSDARSDVPFQWAGGFGCRFLVTVDTEEEFDWNGPFERSGHTTITVPKLERFQLFAQKFGIKPVYFVDYSIIEDDEAARFLKSAVEKNTAAVGVHLHPWVNPPFEEETNNYNSFSGNLSKKLEESKIVRLRAAIAEKTGIQSVIYRAGRYGIGPNTAEILLKQGFLIDSSVRSRFDYSADGGPDFQKIGAEPFWLDDQKRLLEIPLTSAIGSSVTPDEPIIGDQWLAFQIENAGAYPAYARRCFGAGGSYWYSRSIRHRFRPATHLM